MKKAIIVLLFVFTCSTCFADDSEPVTYAMSTAVSTAVMYNLQDQPTWKNWVVATAAGAAFGVLIDNDKEAALAGGFTGAMLGQYFWMAASEDKTVVGVKVSW